MITYRSGWKEASIARDTRFEAVSVARCFKSFVRKDLSVTQVPNGWTPFFISVEHCQSIDASNALHLLQLTRTLYNQDHGLSTFSSSEHFRRDSPNWTPRVRFKLWRSLFRDRTFEIGTPPRPFPFHVCAIQDIFRNPSFEPDSQTSHRFETSKPRTNEFPGGFVTALERRNARKTSEAEAMAPRCPSNLSFIWITATRSAEWIARAAEAPVFSGERFADETVTNSDTLETWKLDGRRRIDKRPNARVDRCVRRDSNYLCRRLSMQMPYLHSITARHAPISAQPGDRGIFPLDFFPRLFPTPSRAIFRDDNSRSLLFTKNNSSSRTNTRTRCDRSNRINFAIVSSYSLSFNENRFSIGIVDLEPSTLQVLTIDRCYD